MKLGGIFFALLAAVLVQSLLSLLLPQQAALFDPFLLITIYYSLTRGEVTGMLVGSLAGWVQELLFGAGVMGVLGLIRALLAFIVGQAGRRFLLTSLAAHAAIILAASLLDGWLWGRLVSLFDLPWREIGVITLLRRGVVNAVVGAVLFRALDRYRARESRP